MTGHTELARALARAEAAGVLPVTSVCNIRCAFCSNYQNPPGTRTYRLGYRPVAEIEAALEGMVHCDQIVIGEAATRIDEGEPFAHPEIRAILRLVRQRFPEKPLVLTTNGLLVTEADLDLLSGLHPLEINLSLNSADPAVRQRLLGDTRPDWVPTLVGRLAEAGLAFHGSLVAVPHLTGWSDTEETILFLAEGGAETVRVFLPGYTRLAPPGLRFDPALHSQLAQVVDRLAAGTVTPINLEPPIIGDLTVRVTGTRADSPARRGGLGRGDIIQSVEGRPPFCRTEAYYQIRAAANPALEVRRGNEILELRLEKPAGDPSGLVFDRDIDPHQVRRLAAAIRRHSRGRGVLILASQFGAPLLRLALTALGLAEPPVVAVPSQHFGGSIQAAGLLVTSDFLSVLHQLGPGWEILILPELAFDPSGLDLTGRHYLELGEWANRVELV
ncbi:MAG: radical SAM protein [Bacillota bacterium]